MAKTVQNDSLAPQIVVLKVDISVSCDTKGIVCFWTDQFHAADKSPSAAATPMLSPDSCDGGVQEGEEAISMSFSRQEGSFQNYGMRRRTEPATWADKDSCLEMDSSGKRNQQSLYYRVKLVEKRFDAAPTFTFRCFSQPARPQQTSVSGHHMRTCDPPLAASLMHAGGFTEKMAA